MTMNTVVVPGFIEIICDSEVVSSIDGTFDFSGVPLELQYSGLMMLSKHRLYLEGKNKGRIELDEQLVHKKKRWWEFWRKTI